MGWFIDREGCGGHEGYLVAVVEREAPLDFLWRERGSGSLLERTCDEMLAKGKKRGLEVRTVQVACDCGWRSPRLIAPFGTWWAPWSVELPTYASEINEHPFEARARRLWVEHVNMETARGGL